MSWLFDPSTWTDAVTKPKAVDFQNIAADLHTRGAAPDGGGFGRANTGWMVLVPGDLPGTSYTVTAASWSSGTATLTIGAHSIAVGQLIQVTSITPTGYNTSGKLVTAITGTQISFSITANPGTYTSGGTVLVGAANAATGMYAMTALGPRVYSGSQWLPPGAYDGPITSVTLANGLNSNIATPAAKILRTSGPTGAFSLGGFTNGFDGRRLEVHNNVAQAMTIVNSDASSSAANRIKTLTGGNVVLRTGTSYASFVYDASLSLWILTSSN